ncbi:MAG: transposase [Gammaproteobacteria bacterium]|nr:transposase [Gammaproteobacteria bacterium]
MIGILGITYYLEGSMTTSRSQQICLTETCYYHCISRCVRRAFLCGYDEYSGKSYQHRRDWVEQQLLRQSQAFCIDVASYAIMSNHYHVIIRVNPELAASLSAEAILDRWQLLYRLDPLMVRFKEGDVLTDEEKNIVDNEIRRMREVLMSISRFMGYLNERIARRANAEDGCKGRFWEGRFRSQALLDDVALLQCLAYVDLNPVRAGISQNPLQSEYTSIKRRLACDSSGLLEFKTDKAGKMSENYNELPFHIKDYLELLEWSGCIIQGDKRESITENAPALIDKFVIEPTRWHAAMKPPLPWHQKALGSARNIKKYCEAIGQRWLRQADYALNYT